ncbi:MAG: response regulator transcription factor [Bacteroidales bacterium]|jgi:two-component system alkaline phosphatase synthesis response regulator PhoP|nr:response regulator transcription factor [Bacteroidales bacterium]
MFNAEDYTILLVDDEADIIEFLSYNLQKEGYKIHSCSNGNQAISMAIKVKPDLILLDIMMPMKDGIETCQELREVKGLENVLIMFLTARAEDYSQIAGFDAGADDYVSKPIKPKVLQKRIKAVLKRAKKMQEENELVQYGGFILDHDRHLVVIDDVEINLPRKEFKLLSLLASKPSKVFSRDEIYNHVWGEDVIVGDRTIDVHIRKIREKIGDNYIITLKGVGYRLNID